MIWFFFVTNDKEKERIDHLPGYCEAIKATKRQCAYYNQVNNGNSATWKIRGNSGWCFGSEIISMN